MPNEQTIPFEISSAHPADAASIARIYAHYVAAKTATFDTEGWSTQQTNRLIACDPPEGFWVAKAHHVLGWASARRFSARPGYRLSLESAVYIDPSICNHGVGTALMNELFLQCKKHRIHHLMAKIIANNRASLQFHERLGYQTVGTQQEIGCVDDQWIDVVILQKLL